MCLVNNCCFCFSLVRGVKLIGAYGLISTLMFVVICALEGNKVFLIFNVFEANYFYLGILLCVLNFAVHFWLWTGVKEKKRLKFLPWLVFIFLLCIWLSAISAHMVFKLIKMREKLDNCDKMTSFAKTARVMTISKECKRLYDDSYSETKLICSLVGALVMIVSNLYFWVVTYSLFYKMSDRNAANEVIDI